MGLCNIECVERIAQYLDVSPGKLQVSDKNVVFIPEYAEKNLPSIQGFSTIVQELVRSSKCSDILGNEKETQALIQQWLEYIVICINYADVPVNANRILNELNTIIKDIPYITGTKKTIADIALYYVLHSIMKELSLQQKAQYIHVSRWFDNIQQEEKLRRELDLISFNFIHLFV
ncbi:PREDICTED: eukaryotic translation elongation factor 1 epsilon-1 [Trachymyrmex cornetzi]|uniref:eukaryotic translation elongation factor 1 epsilon-1 n=1 Tax=Trachymyrmex cornetzi TaxID=471704 RepID=UPI00084F7962|nr:PREDICTED: eukaryotic translation elongation factor 1 epsilon-1 [Trachymyrmex cornetzi]